MAHDLMIFQPLLATLLLGFPPPFHIHATINYLAKWKLKFGSPRFKPIPSQYKVKAQPTNQIYILW